MTHEEKPRREIAYLDGFSMGLIFGANDPARAEERARQRREERKELLQELFLLLESQDTWKF